MVNTILCGYRYFCAACSLLATEQVFQMHPSLLRREEARRHAYSDVEVRQFSSRSAFRNLLLVGRHSPKAFSSALWYR